MAQTTNADIQQITGAEWLAYIRSGAWRQGEHVALIGPTGRGKTTLARSLLLARDYAVVFAVKRYDDTIRDFTNPPRGEPRYRVIKAWPPELADGRRLVFWTKPDSLKGQSKQAETVYSAMESIYSTGGWAVDFDDTSYMCDVLRLQTPITVFLNQGRSAGISAVVSVQRPRRVPVAAFSQSRHTVVFKHDDGYDLERTADIVGVPFRAMTRLNDELGDHDFLAFQSGHAPLFVRNTRKVR